MVYIYLLKYNFEVLYLNIFTCYFLLLLHHNSETNIVLFTLTYDVLLYQ